MNRSKVGGKHRPAKKSARSRRRLRWPKAEDTLQILDRLLRKEFTIPQSGEEQSITALAAIVRQLHQRAIAGDSRASRALMKYERLTARSMETPLRITFVDNEYTRALADDHPEKTNA